MFTYTKRLAVKDLIYGRSCWHGINEGSGELMHVIQYRTLKLHNVIVKLNIIPVQ